MSAPVLMHIDGAVARIAFNRPEQLNALDVATAEAFLACCREIADNRAVRAVILRGEGKAFGAGGDLNALAGDAAGKVEALIGPVHAAVKLIAQIDAPFIASLHGVVAGGSLSLAMACDLAIAAEGTKFNLAYVNVGASCDGSASWSLPRLVGLRNAMAIALLGETFDAAEAWRLGLVNQVAPAPELDARVDEVATRLAAGPTLAIGRIKRLMRSSFDHDLATQLDREQDEFVANARSEDFTNAVAAFLAKQRPTFRGK